jgi:arylsulfatase A-like enzyme
MKSCSRLIAALFALLCGAACGSGSKPNIVFILADDLGWNAVGYHGSQIETPNIDRLAAAGAKLEAFYALPMCTPSRAALLTGRYPIRYGLQSGIIRPSATYGLPLEERTLAQALSAAGYETAIVGKWHLGHYERAYLPTQRGFDHQYGPYNGWIDYFTHERDGGFDWHRDDRVSRDPGYATVLLGDEAVRLIEAHDFAKPLFLYLPFTAPHSPLQAPPEALARRAQIENEDLRTYAAMVYAMDEQIGRVVAAI